MIADTLIRKAAGLGIAGLSTSLSLVESRVRPGSRAQAGLQSARHVLNSAANAIAAQAEHPEASRPQRSAPPREASTPRGEAAEPAADLDAEREAVAEAIRERQPDVGELADPELDVAEVQAQLQAKHAIEEKRRQRT
jgi:hypothetical protein